jgi:NTE family protein
LVLGAGGVLGGAWHVGALNAIVSETGWDPARADYIVGTSAGSMIGALLACGVSPELMASHSTDRARRSAGGASYRLERPGLALGPGSWRLAAASLARPLRYSPAAVVSGWLPRGLVSTEPLKRTIRRACPDGDWAPHPNFWAVAVDYATGRRVAFGRSGAPEAELPDAVAASCAIPGFYRPVEIGDRSYVDGGVYSLSNLDLLRAEPLDLVIALNPVSSLHLGSPRGVTERVAFRVRGAAGRRLGSEAKRLREAGIEVVLIQPSERDLEAMGTNLMSARRRREVTETAMRTVREQLRNTAAGDRLAAAA